MRNSHYGRLLVMVGASFLAMYVLMYAMVNALANVYLNVNQFYMAGLMAAPMAMIELVLMLGMYRDRRVNVLIGASSAVALVVFWLLVRQQVAVTDEQFLRSMIPHHGGAILMCQKAPIRDQEIRRLCESIVASQQAEIDQMKGILQRLDR